MGIGAVTISFFLCACSNSQPIQYVENQEMTLTFSYGERTGNYTGHLTNDLPDGIGKFVSENEEGEEWIYIGEWENGHFNGNGTTWFADGEINASTYKEDIASGSGLFLLQNGSVYFGDIENDLFSGNGTSLSLSGCYNGEFSQNTFNGNGTFYLPNGCSYQGIFKNGFLDGESTISFPSGEKAVGIFHADDFGLDGNGTFYSTDGKEYECTFVNGVLSFVTANEETIEPETSAKILTSEEPEETELADEQATEETKQQKLSEEQAAKEAEEKRLAEEQRLAEEKAAREEEEKHLAEEQAAKEAEEKAAKEAEQQRLAEEQAAKEAEQQRLAEEQAAKEAEQATLAQAPAPQPSAPQNSSPSPSDGSNFNTYDNESQQETSASYVLNTSTMKIHHPSCKSVKKIAPQNYATSNSSVEELIGQGYSTCGNCFK